MMSEENKPKSVNRQKGHFEQDFETENKQENVKSSLTELIAQAKTAPQIIEGLKCKRPWNVLCKECAAECEFEGTEDYEGKWIPLDILKQLQERIEKLDFHLCILLCQAGCEVCSLKELKEDLDLPEKDGLEP